MASHDDNDLNGPRGELARLLARLETRAGLTGGALRLLLEHAEISYPGVHLPLLTSRQPSTQLRFLLRGVVKLVEDQGPFGRTIVDLVGAGEFLCLPPLALADSVRQIVAAVHEGPVVVALMPRGVLVEATGRMPRDNMARLMSWSWRAPWQLAYGKAALLGLPTERRLMSELVRLAPRFGRPYDERWTLLQVRLQQNDLSALIGRARSNVSRAFVKLRKQSLVDRVGDRLLIATSLVRAPGPACSPVVPSRPSTEDAEAAPRPAANH